ncbi:A disintegrin and metalloproteinase with thrombospondin motifs 6 [Eumeta japonica]|uniref:A disintegrin and metalloproteinase with thrombospondin motifs 6 n=1 Tax=Eumeta variegata TaxID=151549 RepID=A0A4C1TLK4_EUMVA|nr:A disintegrin and metalloproteinase with thrombospondin motifs 6 [Eumeta japonica]
MVERIKKALSNCGTKEPKRRIEARLVEWQPQGKVKIQGGRKIRRLRHQHQKAQYKYQTTTTTDVKHQKYQQKHKKHVNIHMQNTNILSSTSSASVPSAQKTKIVLAPQHKHQQQYKKHKQHENHADLKPEFHLQQLLPSSLSPSTTASSFSPSYAATSHHRTRRSISSPRHVETLIVADSTMVGFQHYIETYLLTIMNMVSSLYKDPSIGNAIEIVVRIVLR